MLTDRTQSYTYSYYLECCKRALTIHAATFLEFSLLRMHKNVEMGNERWQYGRSVETKALTKDDCTLENAENREQFFVRVSEFFDIRTAITVIHIFRGSLT